MDWENFIKCLRTGGYEGEADLESVQEYLDESGLDTGTVEIKGVEHDIEALWGERAKQRLDLTTAQMADELETLREEKQAMSSELELLGTKTAEGDEQPFETGDVKVGADRLAFDVKGGYQQAGDFYVDVAKAGSEHYIPERLDSWTKALSTYGNETVGAEGGFAVPPEYRDEILYHVQGEESLLGRTDSYAISGSSITFPDDVTTPWQTSGGILAYWTGEAASISQSRPSLKQQNLRLRKLSCLVPCTDELLADSRAIQTYVTRKAGEKLSFKCDEAIFRGTGAGQPLGFMNGGSLVTVAKESGQAADTIQVENIAKMWARCYGPWRDGAAWYINQDCESSLFTMSVGNWPVYLPAGSVAGQPFATLFGRPVIVTQHCETIGDLGDIVLANLGQYVTAVKSEGVTASSSIHLWFDQDATAFKFQMRVDGMPWMNDTVSPRDGSNTMSAFVALAARA